MKSEAISYLINFSTVRAPRSSSQAVQNMVLKNYCDQQGLIFNLSLTEYAFDMENRPMLFQAINFLSNLPRNDRHLVVFSMHSLPDYKTVRLRFFQSLKSESIRLHCAAERFSASTEKDFYELNLTIDLLDICGSNLGSEYVVR